MKRSVVAVLVVVMAVSVLAMPSPASAYTVGMCDYTVLDPVTGDGQLSAGPLYGDDPLAQETHVVCSFHLDGPDTPFFLGYEASQSGPVVVVPPEFVRWIGGTRGDIWLCTGVYSLPNRPTEVNKGCSYSHTFPSSSPLPVEGAP